jgi:diaminopimelate decarboxylase
VSAWEWRDGRLYVEGLALEALAAEHGTPLYVYSGAAVRAAYDAYARAFQPVPHRICYALKANSNGALLRLLARHGAGADIVSGFELAAALRAGFPPERIVFAGVGKTDAEMEAGLAAGIGEFNCESEAQLERLDALAARRGQRARVALRVNPAIDPRSHPYISTGLRESKFGLDIALARDVLRRARLRPGLEISGLQAHIGSQIVELEPLVSAVRELAGLARELLADGFALRTLDIGGGLGVDYEGHGGTPTPQALAEAIRPLCAELPLTILLEPGRSLVAAAGVLLTRVLETKQHSGPDGRRFVIVDAGMNDLLRPSLYRAFHRIEPVVQSLDDQPRQVVDVVGPVCESGDFLAQQRELPALAPGALLAVRDVGAYGFAMASNYNLRPRPAELLIEDGRARLVRRRETFADLVRTEIEP